MGLFSTNAEIKAALRLTGIPSTGDAQAMFEKALLRASVEIRLALGEAPATAIAAASPAYQDLAKLIECDLVLCELICIMPYASLDGSAGMDEWFDKEAPFRHMDDGERQTLREKLCRRAAEDLEALAEALGIDYDSGSTPDCFIVEPDNCPPKGKFNVSTVSPYSRWGEWGTRPW